MANRGKKKKPKGFNKKAEPAVQKTPTLPNRGSSKKGGKSR